jgi:choline dehydrogenase-like flavoprotein
LVRSGDRITELQAWAMDASGLHPRPVRLTLKAPHFIVAGGAINSPALLLRSEIPNESGLIGQRTFLHPTVVGAALMPQSVRGDAGAPQSLYSDHFLRTQPVDGSIGFKLESAPLQPVLFASTLHGFGAGHHQLMQGFARTQVLLALMRDGFHERSPGGRVRLRSDGTPELEYPLNDYLWEGTRRAYRAMAEIQFAAGAQQVTVVHEQAQLWSTWAEAQRGIEALDLRPLLTRVVSAHVMGGCAMGGDPRRSVTDAAGRVHGLANLQVADGSLFPTSLGANPQETIYALVRRQVSNWLKAQSLNGSRV